MKTKMIKLSKCAFCIYFTVICSLFTFKSFSQGVAINTNGGVANNSAVLDLNVTNQGLLIPRITTNERASIIGTNGEAGATPATGLIIYNTDCNELQYYNGTTWISLINTLSLVAPVAITGSGATGNQITANWNSSTGATHYHLDVSTSSSFANFVTGYNNQDVSNVTSSNVTGLSGVTTYYYRVRAENTCSTSGNSNTITYATPFSCGSALIDSRDSKTYSTVLIGTQCWMSQNLNVGTKVSVATTQASGADNYNASIEKHCYDNDEANCTTYGGIYQWAEAMAYKNGCTNTTSVQPTYPVQGICPSDWHIPSDAEWTTLTTYLGTHYGSSLNVAKSMATTTGWAADGTTGNVGNNQSINNSSGFTALPAGYSWSVTAVFGGIGVVTYWWVSTESEASKALGRYLINNSAVVNLYNDFKLYGSSIRCLKDN